MSPADIDGAIARTDIIRIMLLLVTVAAGIVFIVWLWQARRNAERVHPDWRRRARGWIIGGWICPVVNLWIPFQIVDDVWTASRPPGVVTRNRPVRRWWTA